jgi:hypothetical protein
MTSAGRGGPSKRASRWRAEITARRPAASSAGVAGRPLSGSLIRFCRSSRRAVERSSVACRTAAADVPPSSSRAMTSPAATWPPGVTDTLEIRPLARGSTASAGIDAPVALPVPEVEPVAEAVAPLLLADELGSGIRPAAFASTILPRPPTVRTTSPRVATTVCGDPRAGAGLWSLQRMTPTATTAATEIQSNVRRGRWRSPPFRVEASIPAPLLRDRMPDANSPR